MANFKGNQVEITGLEELIKAFMELPKDSLVYLKEGANEAAAVVLDKAKSKAPVRSGKLRDKLKIGNARLSNKYPYRVFAKVTAAKGVGYYVPLELGHNIKFSQKGNVVGHVDERPYLRPAADESREEARAMMIGAMNKALENMGGKK